MIEFIKEFLIGALAGYGLGKLSWWIINRYIK